MSQAAGSGLGRELYIYWHLAPADLEVAAQAVTTFHNALRLRHGGLQARLLRRVNEPEHKATLMETYAAPGGIPLWLQAEIVADGANAAAAWCRGLRQMDVFEPLPP